MTGSSSGNRCAATVQKIRDTKDDGVYAKLYAEDVGRFLRMVDDMNDNLVAAETAFDATSEGEP